ncbi:hypothetical protein EVAR_22411_1 [Eumeta japonica]|uniref:Uncharacterized protein n=1 Tax=Eumeta variegata TaxID=151549 RepID=A0A4C2A287_EUMVA|nr:hypothetical protein EVAR_22411_1 [Eumeta japonica]
MKEFNNSSSFHTLQVQLISPAAARKLASSTGERPHSQNIASIVAFRAVFETSGGSFPVTPLPTRSFSSHQISYSYLRGRQRTAFSSASSESEQRNRNSKRDGEQNLKSKSGGDEIDDRTKLMTSASECVQGRARSIEIRGASRPRRARARHRQRDDTKPHANTSLGYPRRVSQYARGVRGLRGAKQTRTWPASCDKERMLPELRSHSDLRVLQNQRVSYRPFGRDRSNRNEWLRVRLLAARIATYVPDNEMKTVLGSFQSLLDRSHQYVARLLSRNRLSGERREQANGVEKCDCGRGVGHQNSYSPDETQQRMLVRHLTPYLNKNERAMLWPTWTGSGGEIAHYNRIQTGSSSIGCWLLSWRRRYPQQANSVRWTEYGGGEC